MGIIASVIANTALQKDGRRWVHEVHTDQLGLTYVRDWLAEGADDLNAALAAYAARLSADLATSETQALVERIKIDGSSVVVAISYATVAQLRAALRLAYQSATRTEAVMIADFLAGLTDAQLQALFGLTAGQVTTLRTNRLTPAVTLAANIRSAAGT